MKKIINGSALALFLTSFLGACGDNYPSPSLGKMDIGDPPAGTLAFCNDGQATDSCCAFGGAHFILVPTPTPGTTIKAMPNAQPGADASPLVYYYASDGKRYAFTSIDTMVSWQEPLDSENLFDGVSGFCAQVQEFALDVIVHIAIGGNVTIRPGTYIVGIASDPQRYVIGRHRTLHRLATSDLAEAIYPGTSQVRTRIVPDAFFANYVIGTDVTSADQYDPSVEWNTTMEQELGIIP